MEETNGARSWDEWKTARQSQIVYVNPNFVQNEDILTGQKKGPQTPPEIEIFLDEEVTEEKEKKKEEGELDDEHPPAEQIDQPKKKSLSPISPQSIVAKEEKRSPRDKRSSRHHSRSKERDTKRRRSTSRGRGREKRRRTPSRKSRSSSRDTFDGIRFSPPPIENVRCNQCNRLFPSAHDASVHELRSHDVRIPCAICAKVVLSPARLVNHTEKRHPTEKVRCRFCDEKFGGKASDLSNAQWNDFREHTFRELLRRKIKDYNRRSEEDAALRGIGRCPHGPAIKCRNFPKCPGARCIYSHGRCDFSESCTNNDCPFDHPNRPRICMACVNDLKKRKRTSSPRSRD